MSRGHVLVLEVGKCPAKPAHRCVVGMEIDQAPELRHGASGSLQPSFEEIHQRDSYRPPRTAAACRP